MPARLFDRSRLRLQPLSSRRHGIDLSTIKDLDSVIPETLGKYTDLDRAARRVVRARSAGAPVVVMIGAHVIRSGVQRYLVDLMQQGFLSCVAMNGAGMIHDFELAMIGATTESVAHYLSRGEFGLWEELGLLNEMINRAYGLDPDAGMGASVGREIENRGFPHRDVSILAAGHRLGVPITVHVGIGCDIIHELPNCDGAATGALSYNDFLRFASIVRNLENGVVMSFGSAVTAPEVFLKALSMARNAAHRDGKSIKKFTTLVCDLHRLPGDIKKEASKDSAFYFFRPWKSLLVRAVSDGGESFYVRGLHDETIPRLWKAITRLGTGRSPKPEIPEERCTNRSCGGNR